MRVQSLSKQNEDLVIKLDTIATTLDKAVEFSKVASEKSSLVAKEQGIILGTLNRVTSRINKLQVSNEEVKNYLNTVFPSDLARLYNEARTGR